MDDKEKKAEGKVKKAKNWGSGGGLYRGVKASVKSLNYSITFLSIALVAVVLYLASTSSFTTSFECNGGEAISSVQNKYGDFVDVKTPMKTGYVFTGWFQDRDATKQWNLKEDSVTESMTLYAKWEPAQIRVSFEVQAQQVFEKMLTFHDAYGELPIPEVADSTFVGWQYEGNMVQESTIVSTSGEHTLKAVFE